MLSTGTDARLVTGVPVALPDRSRLTYVGLAEDSRCPRGVQCVHAGSVQVRFTHAQSSATSQVVIHAPRETAAPLGAAWRLVLTDVDGADTTAVQVRLEPRS